MKQYLILLPAFWLLFSCSTLEKASLHGFNNGYYKFIGPKKETQTVYADVSPDRIELYRSFHQKPEQQLYMSISLREDSLVSPVIFRKKSIDIDLTTIPLKYRPATAGLPGQMTTEFNLAIYAGWRHDTYRVISNKDPLGKIHHRINNRGFDFGVFAGPGATPVTAFSTLNRRTDEYSGMILQTGFAGFVETNVASFGIALGFDHLLNRDRSIWIYHQKPWIGFVIGIALN